MSHKVQIKRHTRCSCPVSVVCGDFFVVVIIVTITVKVLLT